MSIQFLKPTLPPWELFKKAVQSFYETGMITNGPVVRQLEIAVEDIFRVGHAVAVSSCTSGLMLALRSLGVKGKVAIPSFTFFATAHAVDWNGLEPVFVDVDEETWTMSPEALRKAVAEHEGITAVMPVHVFGNPCKVKELEAICRENGHFLVYDSAHAMGSKVGDEWVGGFGHAEVFSLTPTKMVVAGEGGIITTGDGELAARLRAGRNYGNEGDYDPEFVGLSARMSEFHAALAIESFRSMELNVRRRNSLAQRYRENLKSVPGIYFQKVPEGCRSTFKDLTIRVVGEEFGMSRDELASYLADSGIETRMYFYPPVHRTKAYWERYGKKYDDFLPVTNRLSREALSLPMWSHMPEGVVDLVCERIIQAHESDVK